MPDLCEHGLGVRELSMHMRFLGLTYVDLGPKHLFPCPQHPGWARSIEIGLRTQLPMLNSPAAHVQVIDTQMVCFFCKQ